SLPKLTLTNLLATIDLEPGDTVYIDSGSYTGSVVVTVDDQGSAGNYVTFQGSTNDWSKGTVLVSPAGTVIEINTAQYIKLADIKTVGGSYGIAFVGGDNCIVERAAVIGAGSGLYGSAAASNILIQYSIICSNNYGIFFPSSPRDWRVENSILYSNKLAAVWDGGTKCSVSNSIIIGPTAFITSVPQSGDYNILWTTNIGVGYDSLASMQKATGNWKWSTVANPQLANPAALDFHPKSIVERYNPETGFWETDTVHSAAIDFGNPVYSAVNEPEPNGGRRNTGLHGNTWQASKGLTNLWLLALSYNDGGSLSAPIDSVYWTGNLTNGETVRIDLSGDGGSTWEVAGTGLLASAGTWLWSNTNLLSSRRARWRIMYEADTNVFDTCNTNFVFKTGGFRYYVNDASTNRDV
ncbi:MAG TPA: right-handed parallel beta-helix repeat-containing protein, partial [Candidatus Sumerlaeota bacterium]|nr:right-handed parallel beta-helix repeat-containing protein [Candidatus Sumerlaeota bacterium]